jgi:cadmium resistance protein CadD (predicted permease)
MFHNHLLYRLVIINACASAAVVAAIAKGYVLPVFASDTTNISYAILALFVLGLASTLNRAMKVSAAINGMKQGHGVDPLKAAKMSIKNDHINDIAKWLAYLGLLGTIIGFKIAVAGSAVEDAQSIKNGIDVAIGTTIVGGILCLWTWVNLRMLDTATHTYQEDVR